MDTHPENIRKTQRAPRSCFYCSQRKTKCDKSIPCEPCRSRGQANDCFVETVKTRTLIFPVNGQASSGRVPPTQPSYAALLEENDRLRSLALPGPTKKTARPISSLVLMDQQEQELYVSLRNHYRPAGISNSSEVIYPSDSCCRVLFSQAADGAWLHSAVSPATLEQQQLQLKPSQVNRESPTPSDASWLALYFSYLTIGITYADETSLYNAGITQDRVALLRENWYDAALYFLHQADFLRLLDVRNIQTISILGAVFSNFGDVNLYYNLLGCAVRIGESLGINNDYTHSTGILPDLRSQRCLWWSLVILDWHNFPFGQPCISDNDFVVEIPSVGSDLTSGPDRNSCRHQTMMCKIAQLLYQFQTTLCASADWENVEIAVAMADEQLLNLMQELSPSAGLVSSNDVYMGIKPSGTRGFCRSTQGQNLLLLLFYYRILINRTLVTRSPSTNSKQIMFERCLESAHSIINLGMAISESGQLVATWSTIKPLYSAANILTVYGNHCHCKPDPEHRSDVTAAIYMFDSLSHKSVYGEYAARKLRRIAQNLV